MFESARVSRHVIRLLATACVAGLATACSNVDVFDPDTWGGESPEQSTTVTDSGAATPSGPQGQTVAEQRDQYPVLADTPSKAPSASSSDEQKQVANGLVADRSQAQYSAEALQAGNEPPAAPPPPADASVALPATPDQGAASGAAATAPPPSTQPAAATAAAVSSMPGTLPANDQGAASTPPAPPPSAPAAQTSPIASAVASAPMTPPPASAPPQAPPVMTDDAALGFQPSHAPALDPAVAQMMGSPAPSRQQRLAATGSAPAAPLNFAGGPPAATVTFSANSTGLDANGVAQVQAAVAAYRAKGGQGYVRVVGHSPSGAPKLPTDRQMMQSFERSQACATMVARELIKLGIPANRVLVDATSTLSDGEQRRAEIFLSS